MAGKQAKVLNAKQQQAMVKWLAETRDPKRNTVIFLLSTRAGLRAKEIAALEWRMVLNSDGTVADEIALEDKAAKKRAGGTIPLRKDLKQALEALHAVAGGSGTTRVIISEKTKKPTTAPVIVNLFERWYRDMQFKDCSSHSGRRTFITNLARKASNAGGSLRDVQALARHSSLTTTQRYIDQDSEAQRKMVDMI